MLQNTTAFHRRSLDKYLQFLTRCFGPTGKLSARHRFNSEEQPSSKPNAGLQKSENGEDDLFPDETPFRGRSRSAPPALWAAKKYGQQLRRMSDEFDTLLLDQKVRYKKNKQRKKDKEVCF